MFKELAKLGGPNLSKEELAAAEKEAAEEAKEYYRLLTIEFTKDPAASRSRHRGRAG
jgi:hypothetical protein